MGKFWCQAYWWYALSTKVAKPGYQKFYSIPQKNGFLAQKRPNLAQNWHYWPNIGIFGPLGPMPDQKTMRTSCLGGSFVFWVLKLLLTPKKIRIFGPKTAKFGPKLAFFGQILAFLAHLVQWPAKKRCKQGAQVVFRYMGTKTFARSRQN